MGRRRVPTGDSVYRVRVDHEQLRREFDAFRAKYAPIVDSIERGDEVSQMLADAARDTRAAARDNSRVRLSWGQFMLASTVAAIAVASFTLQVVQSLT